MIDRRTTDRRMAPHGVDETALIRWLIPGVAVLAALSFGLTYGDPFSNQPVYLLEGIHRARPDFLRNDWFLNQTTQYHERFTWLVYSLERIGFLKWGLALINSAAIFTSLMLTAQILKKLDAKRYLETWLIFLVLFVAVSETKTIAASYLFTPGLQPSILSALGYIAAINFFLRRRFGLSGLCLFLAGLIHTNYLVLGFLFFGAAHLFLGPQQIVRRGLAQFILPFALFCFELPNIIETMGLDLPADIRERATWIFLNNLAMHYLPTEFAATFIPFAGWTIAASAFLVGKDNSTHNLTAFKSLYWGLLLIIAISVLFTSALFVVPVARLFVLRIAPFALMFAQMVIALAVTRAWLGTDRVSTETLSPTRLYAGTTGLIAVFGYSVYENGPFHSHTVIYAILPIALWWPYYARQPMAASTLKLFGGQRIAPVSMTIAAIAIAALAQLPDFRPHKYSLICNDCQATREIALYDWARNETPKDAIFLIPYNLRGMRILGERAVIVDFKAIPYEPDNLVEWDERMAHVAKFYDHEDLSVLPEIIDRYDPDYIVFDRRQGGKPLGRVVFENRRFVVTRTDSVP